MLVYPFGVVYFVILGIVILGVTVSALFSKKMSERARTWLLCGLCVCNIIAFFVYKYYLSIDEEFLILSDLDRFNWYNELPLQFCNINMFLIPIGILLKNRFILGFSFYLAPLGAFMALTFPESSFTGFPLATPRILGYYITHLLVMLCGLLIVALGFYKPRFRDLPGVLAAFVVIALCAHGINVLFRATVCPQSNYFYTFGSDVSILALFWAFLPVPFLYELPAILIAAAYMALVDLLFWLPEKLRKKQLSPV